MAATGTWTLIPDNFFFRYLSFAVEPEKIKKLNKYGIKIS